MPRFRQYLAASFLTAAALVAAASTSPAQTSNVQVVNPASSPVQTKIVNPASAPVPTKIVNTASAPVPVSGTVNIGNAAASPVQAKIVNAASGPVLVRVVDESAREPFQKSLVINQTADTFTYTVPTNRRLVIEFASVHVKTPGDVKVTDITLTTQISSSSAAFAHHLIPYFLGNKVGSLGGNQQFPSDEYTAAQQMRVYAGPGTQVKFNFDTGTVASFRVAAMTISGYLEPVPGAAATSAPLSEANTAAEADWESQNK
jgi:hypothetical protein